MICYLQIRCLTEKACPAWNGALTKIDIRTLESIQRSAVKIILSDKFIKYKAALEKLKIPTLEIRRQKICLLFAKKAAKSNKFSSWFIKNAKKTRACSKYYSPTCRTSIYSKSPLFYLTELLNNE